MLKKKTFNVLRTSLLGCRKLLVLMKKKHPFSFHAPVSPFTRQKSTKQLEVMSTITDTAH